MRIVATASTISVRTQFSATSLRTLRRQAGVSRDVVAFAVGLTTGSIANYEQGRTVPSAEVLARLAGARSAVIELLGRQQCCLTAQQIFDQLRAEGRGVGTASVYRALEQLTKDGFVQRIDIGAGTSRFEPIHADGEHHHHLVCDDCGKVEAFADDELEHALHKVEGQTGCSVAGHDVVLRGACADRASRVRTS